MNVMVGLAKISQEEVVLSLKKEEMTLLLQWIEIRNEKLYRIGWSYLQNQLDIEDALHNAILITYEKIYTLKTDHYFETWFIRIFLNECKKILREKKRSRVMEKIDSDNELPEREKVSNLELSDVMEKLDNDTRELITLKYISGYTHKEIGQIVKMQENTVKTKIHRGLKAIRKLF
ncbi:RNA polymerase sigma factor [Evansella sp. AB-rgal1]|uniref:RNA polymerase sigma factor n=1 Tax=Evansella sp. AB-rgal1 TaxID=3242696 RepID=UPI00359D2F24